MSDADLLAAASGASIPPEVVQGLIARGIPPHVAIGAAAGIGAESKFNPNAVNPTSGAFGYGQLLGPRKEALLNAYGGKPTSDQQLDYLAWEMKGGHPGMATVMSAPDAQTAAELYIRNGMKPGQKDLPADLGRAHQYLASATPQSSPQGNVVPASTAPAPQTAHDPFDPAADASQGTAVSANGADPHDPFDPNVPAGGAANQGGGGSNGVPGNGGGRNAVGTPQGAPGQPAGGPTPGLQPHQLGVAAGIADAGLSGYTAGLIHPVTAALNTIIPLDKLTNPNVKSIWDSSLPDAFKNNLAIERAGSSQFQQDHPALSIGADIGGAAVSPFGKLFAPAKDAGYAKSIGNFMLQGGLYGGVRGASDGASVDSAAIGTGLGMALGPAGAAIGGVLGKGIGAVLKSPALIRDLISSSTKNRIASMIDHGASVDQIHDAIPDSKSIAHIGDWVQYRANGGKAKVTFGEPAPSEVVNDPTPAQTSAPAQAPQASTPQDESPIVIKGKKLAAALGTQGNRRGIEATTDLPPQVQSDVQRLTTAGVSPQEAQAEADIRYIGGQPTVANVTRAPAEQRAMFEGAKRSTPEGAQLADTIAANNQALHDTINQTVEGVGGVPAHGEAAETSAKALAKGSDAERAKVDALYSQADEQAAQLKQTSDTDAAQRQAQADAQAAQDAQAKARAQLNDAQQAYKASKSDLNGDSDKALKALQAARENLRTVTNNPPKAAAVPSRTAPGYIDITPLRQALEAPEMANPNTEGLARLVSGAKGYIDHISGGTNRVTAREAENVRTYLNGAYDPMGAGVNHAIGRLKGVLDTSMDSVPNASDTYKAARAAHKTWAEQYDDPQGVGNLIARDAKGNFLNGDQWRLSENALIDRMNDKPFTQVVAQLKKIGATDALNRLKAGIIQRAYEKATNSARDQLGNPTVSGKIFQTELNRIGIPKLKALFSPQELAHLATVGRAARALNEAVPGTVNTSGTSSSLINALQAAPKNSKAKIAARLLAHGAASLGSPVLGNVGVELGSHAGETVSRKAAEKAVSQGIREQLNPGLARAAAARSQANIKNVQFRAAMGRALRNRGAAPAANDDRAKAIGRKLTNAL